MTARISTRIIAIFLIICLLNSSVMGSMSLVGTEKCRLPQNSLFTSQALATSEVAARTSNPINPIDAIRTLKTETEELHNERNFHIDTPFKKISRLVGRGVAWIVVISAFTVFLPITVSVAAIVKLYSPGPVIFEQERIGYQGKPFTIYKIRTMTNEALENDRTLLWYSNFMRFTKMDELPQVWNIARYGNMQWFAPRPRVKQEVTEEYIAKVLKHTRPGLFSSAVLEHNHLRRKTSKYFRTEEFIDQDIYDLEHYAPIYNTSLVGRTALALMWSFVPERIRPLVRGIMGILHNFAHYPAPVTNMFAPRADSNSNSADNVRIVFDQKIDFSRVEHVDTERWSDKREESRKALLKDIKFSWARSVDTAAFGDAKRAHVSSRVHIWIDALSDRDISADYENVKQKIYASPDELIMEILKNAMDAYAQANREGPVHFRVMQTNTSWIVEVSDQGVGLTPGYEALGTIAGRSGWTRRHVVEGGLGMGLNICRFVSDLHGGRLELESKGSPEKPETAIRLVFPINELIVKVDSQKTGDVTATEWGEREKDNIVIKMMRTLVLFDKKYTTDHSLRVWEDVSRFLEFIKQHEVQNPVSEEDAATIRRAAMLHDIGKMKIVPDPDKVREARESRELLYKDGHLTAEESVMMNNHPKIGETMLDSEGLLEEGLIVRYHHEDFDGKGYPDGLVGKAIPFGARLIRIADSWDAMTHGRMTHNRTNKNAMSIPEALVELKKGKGIQYDPDLVELWIEFVRQTAASPVFSEGPAMASANGTQVARRANAALRQMNRADSEGDFFKYLKLKAQLTRLYTHKAPPQEMQYFTPVLRALWGNIYEMNILSLLILTTSDVEDLLRDNIKAEQKLFIERHRGSPANRGIPEKQVIEDLTEAYLAMVRKMIGMALYTFQFNVETGQTLAWAMHRANYFAKQMVLSAHDAYNSKVQKEREAHQYHRAFAVVSGNFRGQRMPDITVHSRSQREAA
jgi:lipopolysaccharide/colanic/teichoic acid biosynthesis glycosyltransferase